MFIDFPLKEMSRSQVSFLEDPVFHHRNNGDLRASSAVVKDAEKFDLTHHEAGWQSQWGLTFLGEG